MTRNTRSNPYIGPRAFQRGEKLYGRDREVDKLLNLLIAERIVLLYSPSGAGKTSLLQAALIPELQKAGFQVFPPIRVGLNPSSPINSSSRYIFSTLASLEEERSPDQQMPLEELGSLQFVPYLEHREAEMTGSDRSLFIFDQFEEILTIDPNDIPAKKEFFTQLGQALRQRHRWTLFSMREEYLAGLDPFLRFVPTRLRTTFRLDLLGEKAAYQAIQGPANQVGVRFSEAAATKLANDLRRSLVQLPGGKMEEQVSPNVDPVQLQVVCHRLWENLPENANEIRETDIQKAGDVDTALASYYADRIKAAAQELEIQERVIREWVDCYLITRQGIRGQVLKESGQSQGLDNRAIESLINAYLVRAENRRGSTWYELAHDRLIAPVKNDNAVWRETHLSMLQRQAALWESQHRSGGLLLRDEALEAAERWADEHRDELTSVERDFLAACQEARATAEREQRQNRLIRRWAIGATIMFIIAMIAFIGVVYFFHQARDEAENARQAEAIAQKEATKARQAETIAKQERAQSISRELAAAAISNLETDPELSILLSLYALEQLRTSEAVNALYQALQTSRVELTIPAHKGGVSGVDFSPDGMRLASVGRGGEANIWDVQSGENVQNILLGDDAWDVLFTPDGRGIVTANNNGTLSRWNLETSTSVFTIPVGALAYSLDIHPDGTSVVVGGYREKDDGSSSLEGFALMCDLRSGRKIREFPGHTAFVRDAKFSPDGTVMASGSMDRTVRLWQVVSGELLATIPVDDNVHRIAFSPDGRFLAIGNQQTNYNVTVVGTQIWDISQPGKPVKYRTLAGHPDTVDSVLFHPKGQFVATASLDRTIKLWDYTTGQVMLTLPGHGIGGILDMSFYPDGDRLASAGWDGTVRIWDVRPAQPGVTTLIEHRKRLSRVIFSRDGKWLVSGGGDETVVVWNYKKSEKVSAIPVRDMVSDLALSNDSRYLAIADSQESVEIWNMPDGSRFATLTPTTDEGRGQEMMSVSFSRDGQCLAAVSRDGQVSVWDVETGTHLHEFQSTILEAAKVRFTGKGSWLAITGRTGESQNKWSIVLWNPESGNLVILDKSEKAPLYTIDDIASNSDGTLLAAVGADGIPVVWNVETRRIQDELLKHHDSVYGVSFSPDGSLLATASADSTVRVWELDRAGDLAAERMVLLQPEPVYTVDFSPDGGSLMVGGEGGDIRIYFVEIEALKTFADSRLADRSLSNDECRKYFHTPDCPPLPRIDE